MLSRGNLKRTVAAVVAGVLIGGGVTTVTPAGAEVSQFAATNWKKIWKKKLQPQADKRYYTKAASDTKYSTKAETGAAFANYYTKAQADAALAGYYTKAQADAKYQPVGNYAATGSSYTKAESDAKYAPYPSLIRGTYSTVGYANAAGLSIAENISFGYTLPAAPTAHYIPVAGAVPVGCSGSAATPNAAPGHLCVFEAQNVNVGSRAVYNAEGFSGASAFGANARVTSAAAGQVFVYGSWAVRPAAPVTSPSLVAPKSNQSGVRAGQ